MRRGLALERGKGLQQAIMEIFIVNVEDGTVERVTDEPSNELGPSFSPDGETLFFGSDRDGGWHIWSMALGRRAPAKRVTDVGAFSVRVAPDGTSLYLTKYDRPGLFHLALDSGVETPIAPLAGLTDPTGWDFFGDGFLAIAFGMGETRLYAIDAATSDRTELRELPALAGAGFAVDRIRDRVFFTRSVQRESDVLIAPLAGARSANTQVETGRSDP